MKKTVKKAPVKKATIVNAAKVVKKVAKKVIKKGKK